MTIIVKVLELTLNGNLTRIVKVINLTSNGNLTCIDKVLELTLKGSLTCSTSIAIRTQASKLNFLLSINKIETPSAIATWVALTRIGK